MLNPSLSAVIKSMEIYVPPTFTRWVHNVRDTRESPYLDEMREKGVIFTHVPKTGGTSIAKALFGSNTTHIPVYRYYATNKELFYSSFKFAIVRNPWDRMYSAYKYLHRVVGNRSFPDGVWATDMLAGVKDFGEFVDRLRKPSYRYLVTSYGHFRPQVWWLSVPGKGMVMDYVGRLETIKESYDMVSKKLNVNVDLPLTRTTSGPSYVEVYNKNMIEIVRNIYLNDIDTFGYEFY